MKRVLSIILVIVMIFTSLPVQAFAVEPVPQTSVDTGDLKIEGSNSFGNLLSETLQQEQDSDQQDQESYEPGYAVSDLVILENQATVTYATLEKAKLVVALYSEDGMHMLCSANVDVLPEEKEAVVTFDSDMPEYFLASAYLLDVYDLSPLCPAFDTPMYTRDMQELLAMTVEDCVEEYGEDRVYNLDNSSDTNFAVYSEDVILLEETPGVNDVISADLESMVYSFGNADSQITSLREGDVVIYQYEEGDILLFKVASVDLDGTTATIHGSEMELNDAFSLMKLEDERDTSDTILDTDTIHEDLVFNGYVQEDSEGNLTPIPQSRASSASTASYNSRKIDGSFTHKEFISLTLAEKDIFEFGNSYFEGKGKIGAEILFGIAVKLDLYISNVRQYVDLRITPTLKLEVGASGNFKLKGVPLGYTLIPICPGVHVEISPRMTVGVEGEIKGSVNCFFTLGFHAEWRSGSSLKANGIWEPPESELNVEGEVSLFAGLELRPDLSVLGGALVAAKITGELGLKVTGKMGGNLLEPEEGLRLHECSKCVDGDISLVAGLHAEIMFFKSKKVSWKRDILAPVTVKLRDFYWSIDHEELGYGECPYFKYLVTIRTLDANEKPISDIKVFLNDGTELGKSNKNGVVEKVYLSSGDYEFVAYIEGGRASSQAKVGTFQTVTLTTSKEYLKRLAAQKLLMIMPDDVSAQTRLGSGVCGDNVQWTLFTNGVLEITGEGEMDTYSSFSQTPWYKHMDKIVSVRVADKVTSVGSYAFAGCTRLKKVIIEDCVKTLGLNAFQGCTGLTEIKLPVDVVQERYYSSTASNRYRSPFAESNNISKIHYTPGDTGIMADKTSDDYTKLDCYVYSLEWTCREKLTTVILEEGITQIGDYAFYRCSYLKTVAFLGNAPTISGNSFSGVTVNVYYPAENDTWTEDVKQNYGGTLTWTAGFPEHVDLMVTEEAAPVYVLVETEPVMASTMETEPLSLATDTTETVTGPASAEQQTNYVPLPTEDIKIEGNAPTLDAVYEGVYDSEALDSMVLHTATFTGLVPNEQYVMLAVRNLEAEELLSDENLLYVDQLSALEDGTLVFQYILPSDILEQSVFACGASNKNLKDAQIIIPEVSVDDAAFVVDPVVVYDGETLVEYLDYVVVEGNQVTEPGEYTCIIRGICNYTGLVECVYQVAGSSGNVTGDLNLDGEVNSDDLTLLARHVGGIELVYGKALANADVNGDGFVNSDDLTKHARYVGGIITDWDQD